VSSVPERRPSSRYSIFYAEVEFYTGSLHDLSAKSECLAY
jgi:hypothetical protein